MTATKTEPCSCRSGLPAGHAYLGQDGLPLFFRCVRCYERNPKKGAWQRPDGRLSSGMADWDERRRRGYVNLSASQIEQAWGAEEGCMRRWWNKSVRQLPINDDNSRTIFGTVGHACIARHVREQDPFPKGWEVAYSMFDPAKADGVLSAPEQQMCRAMVLHGIESGKLLRRPGARAEVKYELALMEHRGVQVKVLGSIDLMSPGVVEDHKLVKDYRFCPDPEELKKNSAMLIYAMAYAQEYGPWEGNLILRHNNLRKGAERDIRAVEAEISFAELATWIEGRLNPHVRAMVDTMLGANTPDEVDISGKHPQACRKFPPHGCEFAPMCAEGMTVDAFIERALRLKAQAATQLSAPGGQGGTVDFLARFQLTKQTNPGAGGNGAVQAPAVTNAAQLAAGLGAPAPYVGVAYHQPPPQPAAPAAQAPVPLVVTATHTAPPASSAPPWYVAGCTTAGCAKYPGFSEMLLPCKVCHAKGRKLGLPDASTFTLSSQDGRLTWRGMHNGVEVAGQYLVEGMKGPQATVVNAPMAAPAPAPAPAPVQQAAQAVAAPVAAAVQAAPQAVAPAAPTWNGAPDPAPMVAPMPANAPAPAPVHVPIAEAIPGYALPQTQGFVAAANAQALAEMGAPQVTVMHAPDWEVAPKGDGKGEFVLVIGALPEQGMPSDLSLTTILEDCLRTIARAKGALSPWMLSSFDRQDALKAMGQITAGAIIGQRYVFCQETSPEEKALLLGLRPYARRVIRATAGH